MSTLFRTTFLRKRILITGSNGNLGCKLTKFLISARQYDLFLVDIHPESKVKHEASVPIVEYIEADLRAQHTSWTRKLRRTDVVIHFASANSQPDASWTDAADSMDIVFNVLLQSAKARVSRVIIASSCHVAGGWKDSGGLTMAEDGSNSLSGKSEPFVGMLYSAGSTFIDSTAYASSHFAGERLASSLAASYPDTSFLAVRVGHCLPGANKPQSISSQMPGERLSLSTPGSGSSFDDPIVLDEWLRSMWLSNEDFIGIFKNCIECSLEGNKGKCLIFNGVSANAGSRWVSDASQDPLNYQASSNASQVTSCNGLHHAERNGDARASSKS